MNDQQHYLPISKIQEGMILAVDLLDKQGHILLPAGSAISKKILSSLLLHDIHQLCILTKETISLSTNDTDLKNKNQKLENLFRHAPFEEPRNTLANLIKKYRLEGVA